MNVTLFSIPQLSHHNTPDVKLTLTGQTWSDDKNRQTYGVYIDIDIDIDIDSVFWLAPPGDLENLSYVKQSNITFRKRKNMCVCMCV